MTITIEDIKAYEDTLDEAKNTYLRQSGWEHKCNYPGSLWLWEKTLPDGRVIVVCADDAIYMQEHINTEQ